MIIRMPSFLVSGVVREDSDWRKNGMSTMKRRAAQQLPSMHWCSDWNRSSPDICLDVGHVRRYSTESRPVQLAVSVVHRWANSAVWDAERVLHRN